MGFFQDLKEDLSQAVSEFSGEDKISAKKAPETESEGMDIFAAAEESMGITHDEEVVADDNDMEAALGSFLDQVAANAESSEEKYSSAQLEKEEEEYVYTPEPVAEREEYAEKESFDTYSQRETYSTYTPEPEPEPEEELLVTDEVAVVTKNMTVNGDLISTGSLEVMGRVNGNIKVNGELNITGTICGNSEASNIIMTNATITGDVISNGAIKIGTKAVVRGNVYANSAVISGAIKGDIDVRGPVILDSTAIVMGNIKSKAVQINNGAAIEGLCSQCYAEVSPSAFFAD